MKMQFTNSMKRLLPYGTYKCKYCFYVCNMYNEHNMCMVYREEQILYYALCGSGCLK